MPKTIVDVKKQGSSNEGLLFETHNHTLFTGQFSLDCENNNTPYKYIYTFHQNYKLKPPK